MMSSFSFCYNVFNSFHFFFISICKIHHLWNMAKNFIYRDFPYFCIDDFKVVCCRFIVYRKGFKVGSPTLFRWYVHFPYYSWPFMTLATDDLWKHCRQMRNSSKSYYLLFRSFSKFWSSLLICCTCIVKQILTPYINPLPHIDAFCSRWLLNTYWQKRKLLKMSFSLYHNFFNSIKNV